MRRFLAAAALMLTALPAGAQGGGGRQAPVPGEGQEAAVTPAEIQRMFDSYALMQAQEQLQISDDQFPQFLTRFKALQDVRRRALQQRARHIVELRRLGNLPQPDEAAIREHVAALDEVEARAAADTKQAIDAIDQVLDRQPAGEIPRLRRDDGAAQARARQPGAAGEPRQAEMKSV